MACRLHRDGPSRDDLRKPVQVLLGYGVYKMRPDSFV